MPINSQDERQLLRTYAERQDPAALSEFFARYQDELYAFALRVLRNPDDAQDAMQMAFLDVMRRAGEYGRVQSIRGWLYSIVRKACRLIVRSGQRRVRREDEVRQNRGGSMNKKSTPAQDSVDLMDTVLAVLLRLPERYRDPVLLCYCHGLSESETAEALQAREGTIRVQLSRALEMIRAQLTAGGIVLGAVALPELLSQLPMQTAPLSLQQSLQHVAQGGPLRPSIRKIVERAGNGQRSLVLSACAVVCAGLVGFYLYSNRPASVTALTPTPVVAPATSTETATDAPVQTRYTFDDGRPANFQFLNGKVDWQASSGPFKGVLRVEAVSQIQIPLKLDSRPAMSRMRYCGIIDKKSPNYECSLFRIENGPERESRFWHKALHWDTSSHDTFTTPAITVTTYWIGRYSFVFGNDELTHVSEFTKPLETSSILLQLQNVAVDELEIKTLAPSEIPDPLRDPEAFINFRQLILQPSRTEKADSGQKKP